MATTEKMGVITQIEESGNESILYPKTKAKLVEGLIETIKETVQGSGGGGTDEATVDAKISAHNTDSDSHNDIRLQVRGLHNDKADKAGLSLGTASDGLIYIFVDGAPVGTGIQQGQSGDVFGYVDENNTVVLTGNLADGTYTIKYETEDADGNTQTVDIGDLVLDTKTYYTVTSNLTKCTSSNSAKTVAAGGSYQTTITANTGYMITSWKVTMGGVDISSAYESGTVTIEKVTGDIVIMAYAVQTSYSVTNNLSNCSTNNSATTVTYGFPYNATITANEGYVLSSVSVTMGGVAVTATGGVISIASVTGDIVINATATEGAAVEITNWIEEVGYTENTRLSLSSGGTTTANGYECTGFIEAKYGDVLYIENVDLTDENATNIIFYDEAKQPVKTNTPNTSHGTKLSYLFIEKGEQTGNGYSATLLAHGGSIDALTNNFNYIRIGSKSITTDSVLNIKRDSVWL